MTTALHYERSILKRAIGDYIKRVYIKKMVWLSIAATLILVFSLSCISNPWLQAFSIVPALAIPIMLLLGYYLRIQESLKRLSLLDNGNLSLSVDESGVTVESAIGKSEMKWVLFTELWEFSSNYLLLYSNHQFITLPKDQVNPEFIGFIRAHLKPV